MTLVEFIRRQKGMSQAELGRRLGVHPSNLSRVERGFQRPWPKLRRELAQLFEVPEEVLFEADGVPKRVEVRGGDAA